MTRRRADLFASGSFTVLALVFLWSGRELRFTTEQGIPGAGFFPLLLAAATLAMSVALGVQAVRRRSAPDSDTGLADTGPPEQPPPSDSTVLADQTGLESLHAVDVAAPPIPPDDEPLSPTRTMAVWGLVLAGALGLPVLGFIPAMLLLSCGIMFGVERRFDPVSIASAVLLPLLTYVLFGVLLDVRLPLGPFE